MLKIFLAYVYVYVTEARIVLMLLFCLFSIYSRAGMVFHSDFHAQNKTMMSKWNS